MKRITFVLAFFTFSLTFSQGVTVSGTVIESGEDSVALPFTSVSVKGLDIRTETDIDGSYALSLLPGNYVLIFDFIGYEPMELANISVQNSTLVLDPVVLSSYRPGYDLAVIED